MDNWVENYRLDGIYPPVGDYTYDQEGEFEIRLRVTDTQGKTDTIQRRVVISNFGRFILRNVGQEAMAVVLAIYDQDGDREAYDFQRYYLIYPGDSEEITLPGNRHYNLDYYQFGELVDQDSRYLGPGSEVLLEQDLGRGW